MDQLAFFPPSITFNQLTLCSPDVKELYRGFKEIPHVMFQLSTLVLGIFCRKIPETISMAEIRLHKTSNMPGEHYFVGMSEKEIIAKQLGNGCLMTIDPTLLRNHIVDVHKTYKAHGLNLPGRMQQEAEYIAVAIPIFTMKSITLADKKMPNPFYIYIEENSQAAKTAFNELYTAYIHLLRLQQSTLDLKEALQHFLGLYFNFYEQFATVNPFKKTLQQLNTEYPAFMQQFDAENPAYGLSSSLGLFKRAPTLEELVLQAGMHIIDQHEYVKAYKKELHHHRKAQTCYEDDYAKPVYD